jgi:outer membrane protein OmpA-like peptidoglycan-associated protein
VIRPLALAALLPLLAACASGESVTLLPGEGGANTGAVVVLNPKTGKEDALLSAANMRSRLAGRIVAKPADPKRYAKLTQVLPPPAAHFTLYFFEGSTKLTPPSEPELRKVFAELAKRPGAEVQITGHTDTVGSLTDNDALSLKRAQEIREALALQGLKLTITRAVGRGERELLVPTPDSTEEPRNRRVEIIVR